MNAFALRDKLIDDYGAYIKSFITIQDQRISNTVEGELRSGLLWPEPLLQLNPSFEPGPWIDGLVADGTLHTECASIFRIKKEDGSNKPLRLHQHQAEAVKAAASGDSYVLTTGTGSGKSLAYIIPIVDFVLRSGSGHGIRAIVVYPMNALANSQAIELDKFLGRGYPLGKPPVTFRRYTGQENIEEREQILSNPPDILLTNYVMLELLLTRPYEKNIVNAARGHLQFLVLDELHTYRGRQGADVAMLVRRVRDVCANPHLQCVGTSATLAGSGSFADQQRQIAEVASRLFGTTVKPERIIGETLRRVTTEIDFTTTGAREQLRGAVESAADKPPANFDAFKQDALAGWIETTFGLSTEPETGRLKRATPLNISGADGAAHQLSTHIGLPVQTCRQAIERTLLAGYDVPHPETGFPIFAFRLHQFISRGDTVYASLEDSSGRHITTQGQQFVPGDRTRILLPVAFCRECGQEFYTVFRQTDPTTGDVVYLPRLLNDLTGTSDQQSGFLYASEEYPWPENGSEQEIIDRLPEDWLEDTGDGLRVKKASRSRLPKAVRVNTDGKEGAGGGLFHFIRTPFPFCLACGVAYGSRQKSDYGKLAVLSSEGRSTATTVLSLTTLQTLRQDNDLDSEARKLLSFTDNRQDASLQAGHFNDFVEVGTLRAALYQAALAAGPDGISHDMLAQRVFEALKLPFALYASDPEVKFQQRNETDRALREVLAYRIYQDLRRGWRVTSPNLEQCDLLRIDYTSLDELCAAEEEWVACHPTLVDATPTNRAEIARTLLDYLRRELAIKVNYLEPEKQDSMRQLSNQRLREPWAIDEGEQMLRSYTAFPRSRGRGGDEGEASREYLYVSGGSGFGLYLRRPGTLGHYHAKLSVEETEKIIVQLFKVLRVAGLVQVVQEPIRANDVPGYMIPASALVWKMGDGTMPLRDVIRVPRASSKGSRINPYFLRFYRQPTQRLETLRAKEHTAQVPSDERQKREDLFRRAELPLLYCSPTMELGVDIAQLNTLNMRNVPPTPANYAQRSGRAGRSGQPALVFTYCTAGSPHDQYFFKRPKDMVSGAVAPPRIDLANEDLIRAHVHAVWLAEANKSLGKSLKEVLVVEGENPTLELQPTVQAAISSLDARTRARQRLQSILADIQPLLQAAGWYSPDWLQRTLDQVEDEFDRACNRWRDLYRAAIKQRETQNKIIGDASRSVRDKDQAKRLRAEAEAQMELLTTSDALFQSDFNSYRYFASEGFLPGYNFPRLPLSAYIPGRRVGKNVRDEYLNRPRFLAISEFGPRSIIYHEGSRYVVNQVILPADIQNNRGVITTSAKLCPKCGHLHQVQENVSNPDRCEQCNALLDAPLRSLMRMHNVSTRRRDRINSDEEERTRMGYEMITAVRLERDASRTTTRLATVHDEHGAELLHLTYGHAATIWRINKGWRRRKDTTVYGFVLDTERGYWARNEEAVEDDTEDPMSASKQRVVPYVEDHRNCLLIEPVTPLPAEVMASLQPALKHAIQAQYQLEDNELSAEPLPSADNRRLILLYEAAEGGAGILRQLLDDPTALATVATTALELCHFDPATGTDRRRASNAREDCEAACYDCLMSYSNQPDHLLLDRLKIHDLLGRLARSTVTASPVGLPRAAHVARLKTLCDSDLERHWLDYIDQHNLRLPDKAQHTIATCQTKPDFFYSDQAVAVYIDGFYHNFADVMAHDRQITTCLENAGYTVIRFGNQDSWPEIVQRHAWLFGANA